MNIILAISFTLYNANKFKELRDLFGDLAVGIRRGVNELVSIAIHFAHKCKHITKMFTTHPFTCIYQSIRNEVHAVYMGISQIVRC